MKVNVMVQHPNGERERFSCSLSTAVTLLIGASKTSRPYYVEVYDGERLVARCDVAGRIDLFPQSPTSG